MKPSDSEPSAALDDYKELIDGLVEIRPGALSRWIEEKRSWPIIPETPDSEAARAVNEENRAINELVGTLTEGQRPVLAKLLQSARDGGIGDVLAYLNEEPKLRELRIVRNGRQLPIEPFGTELYWDWTCRREGDAWPKLDSGAK